MARQPNRGVGYCQNAECDDYAKGVFLLNHGGSFACPECRHVGRIERERGFYTGNSHLFREVRVEYNFDPVRQIYRDVAIIQDVSLWEESNTYTLQSPLVRTEKRALKVAEAILANLNRGPLPLDRNEIPNAAESIISFDDPTDEFHRKLRALASEWEMSGLRSS